MLAAIRDFFEKNLAAPGVPARKQHTLELATATLLVEVLRADRDIAPATRAAALAAVRGKFGLGGEEAETLLRLAEAESREATDYYQFTSLIRAHYSLEQRERIVELMWKVAYADATLSAHEQHLIRRIADLLYVPHSRYIAAKMRAKNSPSPLGEGRGEGP